MVLLTVSYVLTFSNMVRWVCALVIHLLTTLVTPCHTYIISYGGMGGGGGSKGYCFSFRVVV